MTQGDAGVTPQGTLGRGFGERLRLALGRQSLNSLATASGVAHSLLRKYLAGSEPGLDKAARIAQSLGVTLSWLATGEGPMRPESEQTGHAPPVDEALMEDCIVVVEELFDELGARPKPEAVAGVVMALYREELRAREEGRPRLSGAEIIRLVRRAA